MPNFEKTNFIECTCTAASVFTACAYKAIAGSSWFSFYSTCDKVKGKEGQTISVMSSAMT